MSTNLCFYDSTLRTRDPTESFVGLYLHKGKLQCTTQQGALYDTTAATRAILVYLSGVFFPDGNGQFCVCGTKK
jgi:hypothetical protein